MSDMTQQTGRAARRQPSEPTVVVLPYICPLCNGDPRESGCHHCLQIGLTDDVSGWNPDEVTLAPRPPGVMTQPCADCAFRCGSPEQEMDYELHNLRDPNRPFFCHTGLPIINGSYRPVAEYQVHPAGPVLPLGAKVCAGWWDWRVSGALPLKPYRELHHDPTARPEAGGDETDSPNTGSPGTGSGGGDRDG